MNRQTEIKWGVVWPTSMFLFLCFEFYAGLQQPAHLEWGVIVDSIGGLALPLLVFFLGLRQKRDQDFGGAMNWKQGFVSGLIITAVALPLSLLLTWAFFTFVNPAWFDTMINYSVATGYSGLEDAQAYFNLKSYLTQTAIGTALFGVVLSAIFAFLYKTK